MGWGDIPDLPGLDDEFRGPPVTPSTRVKKRFRPEVEKQRARAVRDFQDDDKVEEYLQSLEAEYDAADERKRISRARIATRTLGEASPERESYTGKGLLGAVRQSRAEKGRTSITGSEAAGTAGMLAGYGLGGLPGLAVEEGVNRGLKAAFGIQPNLRERDSEGRVKPVGGAEQILYNVGPDVGLAAVGPAAKKIRSKRLKSAIRDFLKGGEEGSFRIPGQADDIPEDVARLAFGDAAEAPSGGRFDLSHEDYTDQFKTQESRLQHLSDDDIRSRYDEARAGAIQAQSELDEFGEDEQIRLELMRRLDTARRMGEELYHRTNGKEGMGNRLRNGIIKFIKGESGMSGGNNPLDPRSLFSDDEPLSDLERQLKQSTDMLAQDPEAAKFAFRGNAARTAEQMAEEQRNSSAFYRTGGRLKRTANQMSQAMEGLKKTLQNAFEDETGASSAGNPLDPRTYLPDNGVDKRAAQTEVNKLSNALADAMERGAGPDEVTPIIRDLRAAQRQLDPSLGVPSQTLPPEQPSLLAEGSQASLQSAPQGVQGPNPPPGMSLRQQQRRAALAGDTPGMRGTAQPGNDATTGLLPGPVLENQPAVGNIPRGGPDPNLRQQQRAAALVGDVPGIPGTATPGQDVTTGLLPGPVLENTPQPGAIPTGGPDPNLRQQQLEAGLRSEPSRLAGQEGGSGTTPPPSGGRGGGNGSPPSGPGQYNIDGGFESLNNNGGLARQIFRSILDIPGELIGVKSALSPPFLRQGKVRLVTNPVAAFKELFQSFGAAVNDETALKINQVIKSDPWIRDSGPMRGYTYRDTGGTILELGESPEERDAGIKGGSWLRSKLRNSALYRKSDQQAVIMLNLMRTNWYREVASQMWASGERDLTQYRKLREFIEHSTHRGSWGQQQVPLFFSVRAQAGRAQALWDIAREVPAGFAPLRVDAEGNRTFGITRPGVQQQATKALVGMVAANMAQMGAMAALGLGVIEWKDGVPTLRQGPHHLDPWAGWGGQAKLIIGMGKDIEKTFGDVLNGEKGWEAIPDDFAPRMAGRASHYLGTGLSPFFSVGKATVTGEDFAGHPYQLSQELKDSLKGGGLFSDLVLPINLEEIAATYKESGLGAALATAIPTTLSEGTSTYVSLADLRNDAARKMGYDSFQAASPLTKAEIDAQPEIADFKEKNPNEYQRTLRDRETNSRAIQAAVNAESIFNQGGLDKPIREYWQDEGVARGQLAQDLQAQFAKQFEGFDKTAFQKNLETYYNTEAKDEFGNHDFDATEAARQRFVSTLPPEQQQWIDEALQVSRNKKTPLHQRYLEFIDRKDQNGYFREGITGQEKADLDRANPDLDLEAWYFGGGLKDRSGPALQSVEAVDQAISLGLPNRDVKLANTKRPINQNEGSLQAWDKYGPALEYYVNAGTPDRREEIAQKLFKVGFADLTDKGKEKVRSEIRNNLRKNAELDAALVWWGVTEKPSERAKKHLVQLVKDYGPLLEVK